MKLAKTLVVFAVSVLVFHFLRWLSFVLMLAKFYVAQELAKGLTEKLLIGAASAKKTEQQSD